MSIKNYLGYEVFIEFMKFLKYINNEKMTNESLRERFLLKASQSETASRIIKDTLKQGLIKLDDPTSTSKRYALYVPFWA